jgi:hypothetical protein
MAAMGWVHRHKRRGALFALAALALQIAVSFGHVHVDGIRPAAAHGAVATPHKIVLAQASGQGPAQNGGDDDDYCAICASNFLVSSSFVSEPPKLPVQLAFTRIVRFFSVARDVIAPRRVAFQSRAPPAA